MLYIETYTSPIDALVVGAWGGADGLMSGATGIGRFRVQVGAPCIDVEESAQSLEELAAATLKAGTEAATEVARKQGHDDAVAHAARALEAAVDRLDQAREEAEEALSANSINLAVEIARQILKVQISAGDFALEQIVRSTLSASEIKRGHCAVHLHPEDAEALKDVVFRDETVIVSDGEIPRGSVHLETPRGLLVRDPSAALDEICEHLLEDFA